MRKLATLATAALIVSGSVEAANAQYIGAAVGGTEAAIIVPAVAAAVPSLLDLLAGVSWEA